MGGGASALAAAADTRIRCLATLAAAETNPSASAAAASIQRPACFIVGSQDAIVTPATTQNQFNACDAPRVFASITGGSHCGFIDNPIIACDSGSLARADLDIRLRAVALRAFRAAADLRAGTAGAGMGALAVMGAHGGHIPPLYRAAGVACSVADELDMSIQGTAMSSADDASRKAVRWRAAAEMTFGIWLAWASIAVAAC
jgi:hypothetical protein